MAWSKNGTPHTLSGTSDTITISDLTASKFNQFVYHVLPSGTINNYLAFDNDTTASNYAIRYNYNGGTDTAGANTLQYFNVNNADELVVVYTCNISGEEKLSIAFSVDVKTAGATNAPGRAEFTSKWVTTSGQFSRADVKNTQSGDFATGSNLTALNGDTTEVAVLPTNLQSGSRFEATDTRKIYYTSGFDNSGCKAYYNFEQTSGNLINQATTGNGFSDGLGSSADGTAISDPLYSQTGKIGNAISFDGGFEGAADGFQLGASTSQWNFLHNGSDWTVAFWLKLNATDHGQFQDILVTRPGDQGAGIGLCIYMDDGGANDHKMRISISNGTTQLRLNSSNSYIPKNTTTWYHYVITHTGSSDTINLYRDGGNNESNSTSFTPSVSNASNSLRLAGFGTGSGVYGINGLIDEFLIFDRVLTADEISYLYNSGTGRIVTQFWTEEA